MEIDPELLAKVKNANPEFRKLHEEHAHLGSKVDDFNKLKFLTPEQEVEKQNIKKKKLKHKDRMAEIVSEYHATLH